MRIGYNIETVLGTLPVYTDDTNYDGITTRYMAVRALSPAMQADRNVVMVFPLMSSVGRIRVVDGGEVPYEELPHGDIGGVYVANPIAETDVPDGAVIGVVRIGVFPILALIVCIAVCVVAISGAFVIASYFYDKAWAEVEYQKAQQEYYDYLVEMMEIVDDVSYDLNNDGILDVRTITWKNGRSQSFALSDYGASFLGGDFKVNDPGTAAPAPEPGTSGFNWNLIVAAVIILGVIIGGAFILRILKDRD